MLLVITSLYFALFFLSCQFVPLCHGELDTFNLAINKCCPLGTVITLDAHKPKKMACVKTRAEGDDWVPFFYTEISEKEGKFQESQKKMQPSYEIRNSSMICNTTLKIVTPHERATASNRAEIRLTDSGNLFTRSSGNHMWKKQETMTDGEMIQNFCIDGLVQASTTSQLTDDSVPYDKSEKNQILIYCIEEVDTKTDITAPTIIHLTDMLIACLFLFLVVLTHALTWSKQNIHGRTVTMYSFSFLFFLAFELTHFTINVIQSQNGGYEIIETGTVPCIAIGILIHYFYIATFSWITVLNFDIWLTVCSMAARSVSQSDEKRRFLYYNLFGFGIPTVLVAVSLFIEFYFGYFDDSVVRPQYGNASCGVATSAFLYHAIIASSILFSTSVLLIGCTAKFLAAYFIKTQHIHRSCKSKQWYKMATLFGKVFVLLAVSWVFEIGGMFWAFFCGTLTQWYLVLFDAHNLIQSIGFFWIFCCKKEILEQLKVKFNVFQGAFLWLEEKLHTKSSEVSTVDGS